MAPKQYDLLSGAQDLSVYDYSTPKKTHYRCCDSHPAIPLLDGTVYGSSCLDPAHTEKSPDIYIGFERGMKVVPYDFSTRQVQHIAYPITDMAAPRDAESFKKLVAFSAEQLAQGKVIHAGCIGGHGRTGTYLSALVSVITGEKDSITWVREHYCKKAVESDSQVAFLHKHFGIKKVDGYKTSYGHHSAPLPSGTKSYFGGPSTPKFTPPAKGTYEPVAFKGARKVWNPVKVPERQKLINALMGA